MDWDIPKDIEGIQVIFDSSLQFHFGQSWQGYAVNAIPTIVKEYRIVALLVNESEVVVANVVNNYQRNCFHHFSLENVVSIRIECNATNGIDWAQIYSVRVFKKASDAVK